VRFQLDGFRNGRPVTVAGYYYQDIRHITGGDGFPDTGTTTTDLTVVVARLASRRPALTVYHRTRMFEKPGKPRRSRRGATRTIRFEPEILTGSAEFGRGHTLSGDASQLTPAVITATMQSVPQGWAVQEDMLIVFFGGEPDSSLIDGQVDQALRLASALESPRPSVLAKECRRRPLQHRQPGSAIADFRWSGSSGCATAPGPRNGIETFISRWEATGMCRAALAGTRVRPACVASRRPGAALKRSQRAVQTLAWPSGATPRKGRWPCRP
jgi:hypothetical protein